MASQGQDRVKCPAPGGSAGLGVSSPKVEADAVDIEDPDESVYQAFLHVRPQLFDHIHDLRLYKKLNQSD